MINLDVRTIKILYLLSQNSRIPISNLSKRIYISNDAVKNRITNLQERDLIKSKKININFKLLGFKEFDLYLKLRNYDEKQLNLIIKFLKNSNIITWIGITFGKYDLRLSLVVDNSTKINDLLEDFKLNFKNLLIDYFLVEIIEKYKISLDKIYSNIFDLDINFFSKNLNLILKKKENKIQKKLKKGIFVLNDLDKNIIKLLNLNVNISLIDISNKLNLTPEAIKYRLLNLEKNNIIKSYSIVLNGIKLNKIWAVFLFKLNLDDLNDFKFFLKNQKNISAFVKLLGSWDYSVTVFANNISDIHKILMGFRNKFPRIILNYEMLLLFETYKYPSLPDIIFE